MPVGRSGANLNMDPSNALDQKRAGALGHERKHLYARLLHLDVRRSLMGQQLSSRMALGEHRL